MKIIYFISLFVISCMQRAVVREENFDRKKIINSNLTVSPVNLTFIEGGIFEETVKYDNETREIIELNRIYLSDVRERLQKIRINYRISSYQAETVDFFNKIWYDLHKEKLGIGIKRQPLLSGLWKTYPKSYIKDEMSSSFEKEDYILLYKVDYTAYTKGRKTAIAVSVAPAMLLAAYGGRGLSSADDSYILGDVATLQFVLINRNEQIVKCFGEYTEQGRNGKMSLSKSIEKMFKFIFENGETE